MTTLRKGCGPQCARGLAATLLACLVFATMPLPAAETWQEALARMPLPPNVAELTRTNVAEVLLTALQSNRTVKALVLLPGATDEFYFFLRAHVRLTNSAPTLLGAVVALTNQTQIRATFRAPMLLLHTAEDPTTPQVVVESEATARHLREKPFLTHFAYNDQDWDFVQPILDHALPGRFTGWPVVLPPPKSADSWHFFRHTIAGWGLSCWEATEALSLANKTVVTVKKRSMIFEGDTRIPADAVSRE